MKERKAHSRVMKARTNCCCGIRVRFYTTTGILKDVAAVTDTLRDKYRTEYEKNPVFILFLTILVTFFIVFAVSVVISGGSTFHNILNADPSKIFYDHFESIEYSYDHPYTDPAHVVIYPPLVTVFYALLGRIIVPYADTSVSPLAVAMCQSQMGLITFFIIILLVFCVLYAVFSKILRPMDTKKELMFVLLILLGYPFIYAVERGNSILLALVFCFIFLLGYRSENKILRYLSYIALGCAAGIKIYPAILWLLIIRDKNYKEAGICAAIAAALIFVPFIFTDGNPLIMLDNITSYTGVNLGVTNINQIVLGIFQEFLGFSGSTASVISYAAIGIFTVLSFIVILFDREMKFWKVVALISCNLILGLGVGVQYQIVYMAMPILYFLAAEKEMTKENKFYTICFAMMMVLIPGIEAAGGHSSIVVGAMESAFVIVVAAALLYEGLKRVYRNRRTEQQAVAA